jgi:hypothetical protein
MKIKTLTLFAAMILFAAVGVKGQERKNEEQIITFEAAGASSFTIPVSISPKGEITGYYLDASFKTHGFIRNRDGNITTFDTPGAVETYGTFPTGISPKGEITGFFGANSAVHGFLRDKDGTITAFDVPNEVAFEGTFAQSINPSGDIAGLTGPIIYKCCGSQLGFLRHKDGAITTFEVPGSTATEAISINSRGEITGYFYDVGGEHGFLRHEDGTIVAFDVPGTGTQARSINPSGEITGFYYDANNSLDSGVHGFLRHKDGEITTFDAPSTATVNFEGTFALSINPSGEITGYFYYANNVVHGFVRDINGTFITFDPQGSIATYPTSINPSGVITGHYFDANSRSHGFLRKTGHHEESKDEKDDEGGEDSERPE